MQNHVFGGKIRESHFLVGKFAETHFLAENLRNYIFGEKIME